MTSSLFENDFAVLTSHPTISGIDEAGRGALAGPVVIAAVRLNYDIPIYGLNDSKLLSSKKREELYDIITSTALDYQIVEISNQEIDHINIRQASILGFQQAYEKLSVPTFCLIDGRDIPPRLLYKAQAVIKGDRLHACIAAASILAKVHRDRLMESYSAIYPEYGFESHKGYGTEHHCRMLHSFGRCAIHRQTFKYPNCV